MKQSRLLVLLACLGAAVSAAGLPDTLTRIKGGVVAVGVVALPAKDHPSS